MYECLGRYSSISVTIYLAVVKLADGHFMVMVKYERKQFQFKSNGATKDD